MQHGYMPGHEPMRSTLPMALDDVMCSNITDYLSTQGYGTRPISPTMEIEYASLGNMYPAHFPDWRSLGHVVEADLQRVAA